MSSDPSRRSFWEGSTAWNLTIFSSLAAALMAGFAFYRALRDPAFDPPFSSYDFSSPAEAMKSYDQIRVDGNLFAFVELQAWAKRLPRNATQYHVCKTAVWQDRRLLFVTAEGNGAAQNLTLAFTRDEFGRWLPDDLPKGYERDAPALSASIAAWKRGEL